VFTEFTTGFSNSLIYVVPNMQTQRWDSLPVAVQFIFIPLLESALNTIIPTWWDWNVSLFITHALPRNITRSFPQALCRRRKRWCALFSR
jgi:hypothetical protein